MEVNYKPLISVILPVYNGEKTIVETIQSLLNQSFQNFELLICFDGSTDKSESVVKDKFNDSRIKTISNRLNMGLGRTLNRLIYNCNPSSQYIAMAEQDDLYSPNRFEKQLAIFEMNPNIGLVSGIADFYNGEEVTGQFPGLLVNGYQYPKGEEMFFLNYISQVKVVNSCMMIRKSVHIENGFYFSMHLPSISVDWTYILRFCLVSDIYGISETLVKLRRGKSHDSLTKNRDRVNISSRELIRSMKFEFNHLISEKIYKESVTTQDIFELKSVSKKQIPLKFIKGWVKNPNDKRWRILLKKLVLKK